MKIGVFETNLEETEKLTKMLGEQGLKAADLQFFNEPLTVEKGKDFEILSIFINSTMDSAVIDQLPHLKMISTRSTGFDHIDLKAATAKGIVVCNVPSYGSHTVAEYTFALMLALTRNIYQAIRRVKQEHLFKYEGLRGFDLYGKKLGIVGTGRIGQNVARIAKGFGMEVVAFDIYPNSKAAEEIGFQYVPLEELLSQSDIVTLHTPGGTETHHLIDKEKIKLFKKGALLVNTCRGEVVESEALLEALDQGILAGAALDVLEEENELKIGGTQDNKLVNHPKVLITPHSAFFTVEAEHEILETSAKNIVGFLNNQPQNVVKEV